MDDDFHSPSAKTTRREPPMYLAALLAAVAGICASAFAICTGSAWEAILAILLTGVATLLPGFLDYRRTRQAVKQARHQAGMTKTDPLPVIKQLSAWPEPINHTIH